MEVAVRPDPAILQDHRVVDGRGELAVCDGLGVGEGVAHSPGDLGRGSQGIRVLHACISVPVGGDDLGTGQDAEHVRGAGRLARVRPQGLQLGQEDLVGPQQRLDAHGGDDVRYGAQPGQVLARQQEHGQHAICAIDKSKPFFDFELDGGDPGRGEGVCSRGAPTVGPTTSPSPMRTRAQ